MKIVGTNFHSKESRAILKSLKEGDLVFLKRDPMNRYDANAVLVLVPGVEALMKVGFVAKEQAAELAPIWDGELGMGRLTAEKNIFDFEGFVRLADVRGLLADNEASKQF